MLRFRAASSGSEKNFGENPISTDKADRRNGEITAPRVRVIGSDGSQVGILPTREAISRALAENLDLVEVSPNADPPVCKIMDFGKYIYQRDKQQQAARKKQKQVQIKEIKFRPGTEEGDYGTKMRSIARFLEEGDKVKIVIRYRGREMSHQDIGMQMVDRILNDLGQAVQVEQHARMEGRQAVMVISPKKKLVPTGGPAPAAPASVPAPASAAPAAQKA